MPTRTWTEEADFDFGYDIGRGGYNRESHFNADDPEQDRISPLWDLLIKHYEWPKDTSIAVLGCGFGWCLEYLMNRGYREVWGADNSHYIHRAKHQVDPHDGILRSRVGHRIHPSEFPYPEDVFHFLRATGHLGKPFDVVVTEFLLSSLHDAESIELSKQLREQHVIKPDGQVIHMVVHQWGPEDDTTSTRHTLEMWKHLLPNDTIAQVNGWYWLSCCHE